MAKKVEEAKKVVVDAARAKELALRAGQKVTKNVIPLGEVPRGQATPVHLTIKALD